MPNIVITTESGQIVAEFEIDANASRRFPVGGGTMNRQTDRVLSGIHRALRDADYIERGVDPELPSEKAMRLAAEAERKDDEA